jgi:7-carboxy-7-deazaguanine synthase
MRIAEIFRSIQGEGRLTGVESIFVRASGCNLRCRFCDTAYASWAPEGDDLSVAEILDCVEELRQQPSPAFLAPHCAPRGQEGAASETGVRHIVLTGGEPMLFAELIPLTSRLHDEGWHITVETSGTLYLPVACDLMSISPKLSNSTPPADLDPRWTWRHTLNRHDPNTMRRLLADYDYQLKFVVDCPADCAEVEAYLADFPAIDRDRVMLMPQGVDVDELMGKAHWLEPYCDKHGLAFCPRRHVEWFGAQRGK